jgi:hypothetical protein
MSSWSAWCGADRFATSTEVARALVVEAEVSHRPDVVVIFDGDVPATVCNHAHSDVYVLGRRVARHFEAREVVGFNNHPYDPNWALRCFLVKPSSWF